MAIGLWPLARQYATAARVAEFIPPAGAPTWMRAMFMCYFDQTRDVLDEDWIRYIPCLLATSFLAGLLLLLSSKLDDILRILIPEGPKLF